MLRNSLITACLLLSAYSASAQEIHFLNVPAGYVGRSIPLPKAFAGALAADPERARRIGEKLREKARTYTWRARAEKLADLLATLDSTP